MCEVTSKADGMHLYSTSKCSPSSLQVASQQYLWLRRGALLLQLLDSYAVRYSEMLDGRSEHLPVNELAGGARIRHIFLDIFVNGLQELNPSRHAPSLQISC